MDSPQAQQGMIDNMASPTGMPPEGPPQQGGLIGGMV